MTLYFNKNAIKNKFQHYKVGLVDFFNRLKNSEDSIKQQNQKVDEASIESFPASDPPAHRSKTTEDRHEH